MNSVEIRPIQKEDNTEIAEVIREVLIEMGVPRVGTAYADPTLDEMYETYQHPRMEYFVVSERDRLIGGCGIAPLENGAPEICELQKMYFLSEARGRGIGSQMMTTCLEYARQQHFEQCYLETLPYMEAARKLYQRSGFEYIDGPLGDTGHYNCTMWMIRKL